MTSRVDTFRWFCHDEHELHTLWSVARDHSFPSRSNSIIIKSYFVIIGARHKAIGPVLTQVLIPQELTFCKDVVCCRRLGPSGMGSAM